MHIAHYHHLVVLDLVEVQCPDPLPLSHASWIGDLFTYQSSISYTCDPNTRFIDGFANKTVLCMEDSEWSEDIADCDCM